MAKTTKTKRAYAPVKAPKPVKKKVPWTRKDAVKSLRGDKTPLSSRVAGYMEDKSRKKAKK